MSFPQDFAPLFFTLFCGIDQSCREYDRSNVGFQMHGIDLNDQPAFLAVCTDHDFPLSTAMFFFQYPEAKQEIVAVDDILSVPVYLEMTKSNGAPLLWVLLSSSKEVDAGIMESYVFNANDIDI